MSCVCPRPLSQTSAVSCTGHFTRLHANLSSRLRTVHGWKGEFLGGGRGWGWGGRGVGLLPLLALAGIYRPGGVLMRLHRAAV